MVVGSFLLTLILMFIMWIGIYLNPDSIWRGMKDVVLLIGMISFIFSQLNLCNLKFYVIPFIIILSTNFYLIRNELFMPQWSDLGTTYFVLILLFYIVIAPGLIGSFISDLISRYIKSKKMRLKIILPIIIGTTIFIIPKIVAERNSFYQSKSHAMTMGEPDLSVNANELNNTKITAFINHPISEGKNLIWCATMQMTWNELCNLFGEKVHFKEGNNIVNELNKKEVTKEDLDEETFVAIAGDENIDAFEKITEELKIKFGRDADPELMPVFQRGLFGYSYLFINMPFEWEFEKIDSPLQFKGEEIKTFGILMNEQKNDQEVRVAEQILVYDLKNEDNFIVELTTVKNNHKLILAKIPPNETLKKTIESVQQRISVSEAIELGMQKSFIVPILNFKILKDFQELTNKILNIKNKKYNGKKLALIQQLIRFKLDESGATLKSEATSFFCIDLQPDLIFDKPFLIMLKYKGSRNPYFAVWVDNPEILVKY